MRQIESTDRSGGGVHPEGVPPEARDVSRPLPFRATEPTAGPIDLPRDDPSNLREKLLVGPDLRFLPQLPDMFFDRRFPLVGQHDSADLLPDFVERYRFPF